MSVGGSGGSRKVMKRQHEVLVGTEIKQLEGKFKMKKKKKNRKQWLW